jgi:toxin ParE1/3/4
MSYAILPQAEADLEAIGDYIAQDNPARAVTFVQEFHETFTQLAEMPLSGSARPYLGPGIRVRPVGRYVVYYRPVSDGVEIVRVLHSARDVDQDLFAG